jgi:ATP-dependent RNA helicase DHX57
MTFLIQISSHKNLQHVLPPEHRLYWQHLETVRKQDMQSGKDYMYQPDPFLAKKQREARLIQLEAQRAEAAAKKLADEERGVLHNEGKDRKWDSSPVVEMGLQTRRMVERVIRTRYQWSGEKMRKEALEEIVAKLSKLGFRSSHVEEACEFTKDEEEALEWLLIYVPEDDLPRRFLPRDYATGVSIVAPTAESLAIDFAAERTSSIGYANNRTRSRWISTGNLSTSFAVRRRKRIPRRPETFSASVGIDRRRCCCGAG